MYIPDLSVPAVFLDLEIGYAVDYADGYFAAAHPEEEVFEKLAEGEDIAALEASEEVLGYEVEVRLGEVGIHEELGDQAGHQGAGTLAWIAGVARESSVPCAEVVEDDEAEGFGQRGGERGAEDGDR